MAKHDKSIKIALDSKKLNDSIHKNKYEMQSIDHLMDTLVCNISELKHNNWTIYFSKMDLNMHIPSHQNKHLHQKD